MAKDEVDKGVNQQDNGADNATKIAEEIVNLFDIFQIKQAGDYTLHLQLRLIQAAEDVSGKTYYPLTLLPEVVAYLKIEPKDLPPKNP